MDDVCGTFGSREETAVSHALYAKAVPSEDGGDGGGRAGGQGRTHETGYGIADVGEHTFRRDVLCEIAAAVGCHQHFGAYAGLAFNHYTAKTSFGGGKSREKPCRPSTDDGERHRMVCKGYMFHGEVRRRRRRKPRISGSRNHAAMK